MSIENAPKFIVDIYKLGNWRLILSLFGCASAFTVGAVIELGINFLPIIDKLHMVSVMGFYTLAFYFLIVILSHLWKYFFFQLDTADDSPLLVTFLFNALVPLVVFGATIVVVLLIRDMTETSYNSRNISFVLISLTNALTMGLQNTLLVRLTVLFLLILALRRFIKIVITKLFGELGDSAYRRASNQLSLFLAALLMMIFLEAGSVWTRISYFTPPSMVISYVDVTQPNVRVGIVIQAQNGFIGIADGNRFPEYFGWNSIRRITPIGRK